MKKLFAQILTVLLFSGYTVNAQNVYFVDQTNPTCNDNNTGDELNPWCTIGKANQTLMAGDSVYIKTGVYLDDGIAPVNSGLPGQYIVYKTWQNDSVNISKNLTNLDAINIESKSYIVVDGITVTSIRKYIVGRFAGCHHNIIQNNYFAGGTSFTLAHFRDGCTYNKILNNHFQDGGDHLLLQGCNYNVVEGNEFYHASHANFAIRCGNYNIIRNNYFYNSTQKIGEVYDCDITSTYNATKYNLIEGNRFAFTPSSGDASPFSGIQFAGQNTIVRRNMFYDNVGGAINMALYGTEANFNLSNRFVHNVFYKNRHAAVHTTEGSPGKFIDDNIFKNNIFYKNFFETNDTRWPWWVNDLDNVRVQIKLSSPQGTFYDQNNIFHSTPNDNEVIVWGWRTPAMTPAWNTVTWWETNYDSTFVNNIEEEPLFVDDVNYDFHLTGASPMIDAGAFLTTTVGAGSGTTMVVADAGFFFDGYGIPGEVGDTIQLAGQTQRAVITNINYSTHTLTLNTSLTWADNQGVSLKYEANQPDMGVYEYGTAVGLKEESELKMSLFPNPAEDVVFIAFDDLYSYVSIEIYDLSGKQLKRINVNNVKAYHLKTMDMSSGVYFIKIVADHKLTTQKLIVK